MAIRPDGIPFRPTKVDIRFSGRYTFQTKNIRRVNDIATNDIAPEEYPPAGGRETLPRLREAFAGAGEKSPGRLAE